MAGESDYVLFVWEKDPTTIVVGSFINFVMLEAVLGICHCLTKKTVLGNSLSYTQIPNPLNTGTVLRTQ